MSEKFLQTPIAYLESLSSQHADLLKKEIAVFTFEDLLLYYPFRYIDKTKCQKIKGISEGAATPFVQVVGKIIKKETTQLKQTKRLIAYLDDGTGTIELTWFQGIKWFDKLIQLGLTFIAFGKPRVFNGKVSLIHPELEPYQQFVMRKSGLQPVYRSTEKLKQFNLDSRGIRKLQAKLTHEAKNHIKENLPNFILRKYNLLPRNQAIQQIHFPESHGLLIAAQKRLKFEELFFIQLKLLKNKLLKTHRFKGAVFEKVGDIFNTFYKKLPFELTNAQKHVLKEIRLDTQRGVQMNRLLQGDVGSGKTIVALMSMLLAIDNGYQACMMAPTEILAQQHFLSIKDLLGDSLVSCALLTSATPKKDRALLLRQLHEGLIHLVVGTHALIEDVVRFKNLGFVVIDEQHRFGVEQRAKLWQKSHTLPHVLVMTATPIPRTLAMTLYGDLDVSVINQLPPGRKLVKTMHLYPSQRLRMFGFIKQEIAKGRQAYIVYPLIKESETLDLLNIEQGLEALSREFPLPTYQMSIMHGRLSPTEKALEMQRFVEGKTHIMVATTVVEVGVNVPNATIMIVENAERFGLSQLHQLRGRVGRGAEQSYCLLMSGNRLTKEAKARLETMVNTNDGFQIAEADLKLRGPGDLSGTQQSGVLELKIANLTTDQPLLLIARAEVMEIFNKDPQLNSPEYAAMKKYVGSHEHLSWDKIS